MRPAGRRRRAVYPTRRARGAHRRRRPHPRPSPGDRQLHRRGRRRPAAVLPHRTGFRRRVAGTSRRAAGAIGTPRSSRRGSTSARPCGASSSCRRPSMTTSRPSCSWPGVMRSSTASRSRPSRTNCCTNPTATSSVRHSRRWKTSCPRPRHPPHPGCHSQPTSGRSRNAAPSASRTYGFTDRSVEPATVRALQRARTPNRPRSGRWWESRAREPRRRSRRTRPRRVQRPVRRATTGHTHTAWPGSGRILRTRARVHVRPDVRQRSLDRGA